MLFILLAFLWGLAEATLFFIVPDVLLTLLALFDLKLALWGAIFSLAGALIGGASMYLWGKSRFASALKAVAALPGISLALIEREKKSLLQKGPWAIALGPLKGVPYKIYAICAPSSGISFSRFLLISIPARGSRFLLSIFAADLLFHHAGWTTALEVQIGILAVFWTAFYVWYFKQMSQLQNSPPPENR